MLIFCFFCCDKFLIENVFVRTRAHLQTNTWITWSHEIQQFIRVFAHEWLEMVAGNVVPFQSIVVEVVQNRQTRFIITFTLIRKKQLSKKLLLMYVLCVLKIRSHFRNYHLVQLHDYQVELDHILQCNSSRQCSVEMLVLFIWII